MDWMNERYELAAERIGQIAKEQETAEKFREYFARAASWLMLADEERGFVEKGGLASASMEELAAHNRAMYEEVLPENYETSYANPAYAVSKLGEKFGPLMAALMYELRSVVSFVYRGEKERTLIRMELFLEIYCAFSAAFGEARDDEEKYQIPAYDYIREKIALYLNDYAEDETEAWIGSRLTSRDDFAVKIVSESDLNDLRYLYRYGVYISDNELGVAKHLQGVSEETIGKMADTYTEGYRIGFEVGGKDLSYKRTAGIYCRAGFERMLRRAIENFRKIGLKPAFAPEIQSLFFSYSYGGNGYYGSNPNPQYDFDHREDLAIFLDENLANRRTEALRNAYNTLKEETRLFAGPAVVETFGEVPFEPAFKAEAPRYSKEQQKFCNKMRRKSVELYAEAVVAKDRSFTIIAFPIPEIVVGMENVRYGEIFDEVIKVNTLDYKTYSDIQSKMIDVLNTARHVEVKGMNGNRTDLTIMLYQPADRDKEVNFENCVADVNIPVGEVFTTPVLKGTQGTLHVSEVYLEGLNFKDLTLEFKDGRVCDYSCGNFEDPEAGKAYISENILFHHEHLPMGECAIGTNTTAYRFARDYGIAQRLPILIAEKTGPHFAVGDTCYTNDEENEVFNPDGRKIVAKDNEVSILRLTDSSKAYFGCHTDITISYEELGEFTAVLEDGTRIPVLSEGRFVLPGTEFLNVPLDK